MILQSLHALYDRLEREPGYDIAPEGRSVQKVAFVVVIGEDGGLVEIQDARVQEKGRLVPRRVQVLGSTKPSGSGMNPCFLWDAPGYALGWDHRPERAERAARTFEAFRKRHLDVERDVGDAHFSAVCRFLETWQPALAASWPVLEEVKTGFVVFRVRGEEGYVHQRKRIQDWWDERTGLDPERMSRWWESSPRGEAGEAEGVEGQCLVTGRRGRIARLHPKIKGVAGAQTSGATIAGFNKPSFWSYGLEQSYNAPVSVDAARRYTVALNALLQGPRRDRHRVVIGGTTVVFWTERPTATENVFARFLAEGSGLLTSAQDEAVLSKLRIFLAALRRGREEYGNLDESPDRTACFLLGLAAPTPARIAVRFFHRGTIGDLLENLRRHHRDIAMERRYGEHSRHPDPEFPSIYQLLRETSPPGGEIPPLLPAAILEAVVGGKRYPDSACGAVLRRIRADGKVNYFRGCVIRGWLVRNQGKEVPVSLDTERQDPAYRLGRLFAVLEKTQQDALGSLSASIRERFYSSASATPATVFPRLLRTYQHHLAKLGDAGWKISREKLVQEILEPVKVFPAHLDLEGQGMFALGYYHQMNDLYRSRAERAASAPE